MAITLTKTLQTVEYDLYIKSSVIISLVYSGGVGHEGV